MADRLQSIRRAIGSTSVGRDAYDSVSIDDWTTTEELDAVANKIAALDPWCDQTAHEIIGTLGVSESVCERAVENVEEALDLCHFCVQTTTACICLPCALDEVKSCGVCQ